jgi:hypothetical protein
VVFRVRLAELKLVFGSVRWEKRIDAGCKDGTDICGQSEWFFYGLRYEIENPLCL